MAYANVDDYVSVRNGIMVLHEAELMTRDSRAAIRSIRSRVLHQNDKDGSSVIQLELRMCDKLKALQMLGAYLGMWDGKGELADGMK